MAPEQLEGADADARSDIFALGAVLYEMATGRKAFEGKTQASLIAAILEREPPPITTLQPIAPAALERIIRVALAKDPDDRWQTARDVVRELKELAPSSVSQTVVGAPVVVRASSSSRERIAWAVAALAVALAAFAGWRVWQAGSDAAAAEVTRFTFTAPPKTQFISNTILSVSPNGRYVVFLAGETGSAATAKLWLRSMDATEAVPISGTEGAGVPFWSPDSRFIGFFADGKLKKLSPAGGPPQVLCDAPTRGANRGGGSWSANDVIVFQPSNEGPLFRVSGAGGVPVAATKLDAARKEVAHRYPSFLPDGRHFLFVAQPGGAIVVGAVDSDEHKVIMQADSKPEFVPPDHLLFVRQTSLMTQRFDPKRLELVGDAVPVGQNVRVNPTFGSAAFSSSSNGVLAYGGGTSSSISRLEWIDRNGGTAVALDGMFDYRSLALSADGRRVVAHRHESQGAAGAGAGGLWATDLDRGVTSRFTLTTAHEENPVWSPDGTKIAFASARDGQPAAIYVKSANGTGAEELLLKAAGDVRPTDWSPDGKWLAYVATDPKGGDDLYVLPLTGDRTPRAIARTPFPEGAGRFSPDGRFIAYHSPESRRFEVYVQSLGADGSRWQVSTAGGIYPLWRRDGSELFYLSPNDISVLSVPIDLRSATPIAGPPKQVLKSRIFGTTAGLTYAVTADGKRFLAANELEQDAATLTVVVNWTSGLKKEK
jgi:Tol biopolymer transport system component